MGIPTVTIALERRPNGLKITATAAAKRITRQHEDDHHNSSKQTTLHHKNDCHNSSKKTTGQHGEMTVTRAPKRRTDGLKITGTSSKPSQQLENGRRLRI